MEAQSLAISPQRLPEERVAAAVEMAAPAETLQRPHQMEQALIAEIPGADVQANPAQLRERDRVGVAAVVLKQLLLLP